MIIQMMNINFATRIDTMRIGGLFFFVCLLALNVSGQDVVVKGRVLDSATRKPVSFASVVNPGRGRGTSTSVDGSFTLVVNKLGDPLQVSSIGYKKRSWKAAEGFNEIYLSPSNANMEAIVIKPNDIQDPLALRIIRKAIDNKKINDPEELGSFSYNTYSKGIVDTLQGDKAKKASGKIVGPSVNQDTGRYQFMVETFVEHKYKKPGLHNNKMTAQRVSGLPNPYVIGLITQIQYYSFYKDDFAMLGSSYHNPVSNKYYRSYVFNLLDSIKGADDVMTYIIAFRPRYKSLGKDLMRGQVHIHGGDYAIVNVDAAAYFSSTTSSLRFKQSYTKTEEHWFPEQLETQLLLLPSDDEAEREAEGDGALKFNVISYLKDVKINPDLKRSQFTNYEIVVDENSGKKSDAYWNERRVVPLDMSEIRTFKHMDSLFKADTGIRKFNRRMDMIGYFVSGKIPVGNFNIDLNEIIKLNDYETVRLGFGMSTNDRFSVHHKFGASFGYGFRDNAWKYGGYYEYRPREDGDFTLGLQYRKDIYLWGMSHLLQPGIRSRNYQYLLNDRADDIQKLEAYARFRMLKKVQARAFVNVQDRSFNHGYAYTYKGEQYNEAGLYEAGIQMVTRFKQSKLKYGSLELSGFKKDDPRLALDLRYGGSVANEDGLNYVRLEGLYENNFNLGRLGKMKYVLTAGHITGRTPYSMLFSNLGTGRRSFDLFVPATFSTMAPLEFTNTSYGAVYTEFETGYIIQSRKKWGISIFLPNSIGIGRYDQDLTHSVPVQVMDRLYAETGFGLKFRSRKRTLGFAAMYRYGNYAFDQFGDNISFRILSDW